MIDFIQRIEIAKDRDATSDKPPVTHCLSKRIVEDFNHLIGGPSLPEARQERDEKPE